MLAISLHVHKEMKIRCSECPTGPFVKIYNLTSLATAFNGVTRFFVEY